MNPVQNLKEFLASNVFYGFGWPFYFQDLDSRYLKGEVTTKNSNLEIVHNLINKIDFKKLAIFTLDDLYAMFNYQTVLKEFINERRYSLPEKIASIKNAKVKIEKCLN